MTVSVAPCKLRLIGLLLMFFDSENAPKSRQKIVIQTQSGLISRTSRPPKMESWFSVILRPAAKLDFTYWRFSPYSVLQVLTRFSDHLKKLRRIKVVEPWISASRLRWKNFDELLLYFKTARIIQAGQECLTVLTDRRTQQLLQVSKGFVWIRNYLWLLPIEFKLI